MTRSFKLSAKVKIDASKMAGNKIEGVSLMEVGPALGHEVYVDGDFLPIMVDETLLDQVVECCSNYKNGVKVKLDHFGGVKDIVGYIDNIERKKDKVLGDLNLLENSAYNEYVKELADKIPDCFGLSLAFSGGVDTDAEAEEAYARCSMVYSCDLVTEPAANSTGLFKAKVDSVLKDMDIKELSALLDSKINPLLERVTALEVKPAPAAVTPPVVAPVVPATPVVELSASDKLLAEVLSFMKDSKASQDAVNKDLVSKLSSAGIQPAVVPPAPVAGTPAAPANPAAPAPKLFEELVYDEIIASKCKPYQAVTKIRLSHPDAHVDYMRRTVAESEELQFRQMAGTATKGEVLSTHVKHSLLNGKKD